MESKKTLRDFIIPLSDYPHMPYWGTLKEAVVQLNVAYETGHHTVLVFDEAYKLVGMVNQKHILNGLVPKFAEQYKEWVTIVWDDLVAESSQKRLAVPVKEIMAPAKATADVEDSILKAVHMMLQENIFLLPVMEKGKILGVVQMGELFHDITKVILKL